MYHNLWLIKSNAWLKRLLCCFWLSAAIRDTKARRVTGSGDFTGKSVPLYLFIEKQRPSPHPKQSKTQTSNVDTPQCLSNMSVDSIPVPIPSPSNLSPDEFSRCRSLETEYSRRLASMYRRITSHGKARWKWYGNFDISGWIGFDFGESAYWKLFSGYLVFPFLFEIINRSDGRFKGGEGGVGRFRAQAWWWAFLVRAWRSVHMIACLDLQ